MPTSRTEEICSPRRFVSHFSQAIISLCNSESLHHHAYPTTSDEHLALSRHLEDSTPLLCQPSPVSIRPSTSQTPKALLRHDPWCPIRHSSRGCEKSAGTGRRAYIPTRGCYIWWMQIRARRRWRRAEIRSYIGS